MSGGTGGRGCTPVIIASIACAKSRAVCKTGATKTCVPYRMRSCAERSRRVLDRVGGVCCPREELLQEIIWRQSVAPATLPCNALSNLFKAYADGPREKRRLFENVEHGRDRRQQRFDGPRRAAAADAIHSTSTTTLVHTANNRREETPHAVVGGEGKKGR